MNASTLPRTVTTLLTFIAIVMAVCLSQAFGQNDGHDHAHEEPAHEAESHEAHAPSHDDDGHNDHADEHDSHGDEHGHDEHDTHTDEHSGHADEDGHDEHGHDDHEDAGLHITPETMAEFGIEVRTAAVGPMDTGLQLVGEVVFNADRIAHVTPNVSGIAEVVNRSVGDRVEAGDVMAVLSSRDLAAARSEYLAALARKALAVEMLSRDEKLVADRIGTERQRLESQQQMREAEISLNLAEHNLHALGESHETIVALKDADDTTFAEYLMRAPISGIVIERHLTHGELISDQTNEPPFVVADLSSVWVDLTVYQRDLAQVRPGLAVRITFGHGIPDATGEIAFVSPAFDEHTRTATARVVLDNPEGQWRPGLFVTAHLSTDQASGAVVVPRSALAQVEGKTVVFIQNDDGFEPRDVQLGTTTEGYAQIVTGLEPGERYVASNVLALKAELNRAELEHAGHVH